MADRRAVPEPEPVAAGRGWGETLRRLCAAAAWASLIAIAILSLMPAKRLVRTDEVVAVPVAGWLEHVAAYGAAALLVGLAYAVTLRATLRVGLLSAYAILLELLQFQAIGRNPSVFDALAGSGGALAGTILAAALLGVAGRGRR